MQGSTYDDNPDAIDAEEMYTDTSMFNAEEIVKQIEETANRRKALEAENALDARRRAEILREEKRLQRELEDLDGFSLDD